MLGRRTAADCAEGLGDYSRERRAECRNQASWCKQGNTQGGLERRPAAREGFVEASGVAGEPALAAALRCWCTEIPTFLSYFPNQYLEFSVFTAHQSKHEIFVG